MTWVDTTAEVDFHYCILPVWTSETISDNDAWPDWTPDTPDWYAYSLRFYEEEGVQKWRIANHSGASEETPWYDGGGSGAVEQGVPLSGTMDWNAMYAAETDVGEYHPPLDVNHGEIPGGAAAHGGGPMCWDMDWSWGSEAIPLQFPGFDVTVTGSLPENYQVTLTPAGAGATNLTVEVPDITAISVDPTSIDFGSLIPGQMSDIFDIGVTNVGTRTATVDVDVTGDLLFTENLQLRHSSNVPTWSAVNPWDDIITGLTMDSLQTLNTRLPVPIGHIPVGEETAQLTFTVTGE